MIKLKWVPFLIVILGLLVSHIRLSAQSNPYRPSVVPPSPNAASLAKYGDHPVSPYTGTTDITIPIHSIQLRGLSVPISVSYHTGGIRMAEEAGWVGLGWALNAGGVVTRSIMDKDDFTQGYFGSSVPEIKSHLIEPPSYLSQPSLGKYAYGFMCNYNVYTETQTVNFGNAFSNSSTPTYDMEADVFTFNFVGRSGKFILGRDGKVVLQKQENLKIEYGSNGSHFIITDEGGNKYYFLDVEATQKITGVDLRNSSWYLSKIITQQKDSVVFNYSLESTWTTVVGNMHETIRIGCAGAEGVYVTNDVGQSYRNRTLQSIDYSYGKVLFSFDGNRVDLQNGIKLNSIKLYAKDKNGTLTYLKEHQLYYSYFDPIPSASNQLEFKRLRLDSLKEVSGITALPPYAFTYNMPLNATMTEKHGKSVDHWGFFNGKSNTYFMPGYTGLIHPMGSSMYFDETRADREADSTYMQAFSLSKVTYPTGGSSLLEYQSHLYDRQNSINGPREYEHIPLITKNETVRVNANGSFSGTIDFSKLYMPTSSGINGNLTISFRAANSDSLNYYHNNLGFDKIYFVFQNNKTDVTNTGLICSGTMSGANCLGNLYSLSIPLTIPSSGSYTWTAYIDPKVKISTGFMEIQAVFTWKEALHANRTELVAGGLRIKTVTDYSSTGTVAKKKSYEYGYLLDKNGDGIPEPYSYGRLMSFLSYGYSEFMYINTANGTTTCNSFTRYSTPVTSLSGVTGTIVGYDQVTEYSIDPGTGQDNGKTVYTYYNSADSTVTYKDKRLPGTLNMGNNLNGLLLNKTDFVNQSGTYSKLAETQNYYRTANRKIYYFPKYHFVTATTGFAQGCPNGTAIPQHYFVSFYPFKSEKVLLDSTRQLLYSQGDPTKSVATFGTFSYDNSLHYQETRAATQDSKGNTRVSFTRYPQDYLAGSSTGNIVLDSLIAKNMVASIIEKRDSFYYKGSTAGYIMGAQASTFKLLTGVIAQDKQYKLEVASPLTNFQPLAVNTGNITLDSRYRQMVTMEAYDNDYNITQFTTVDGLPNSFIWDYNGRYPVAQVTKAAKDQIAYTSFEADGFGGWNGIIPSLYATSGVTGRKHYNGSSFSFSKAGLTSSTSYLVSYWSRNGAYNVTGTQTGYPKLLRSTSSDGNSWACYEHLVTGQSTITVSGSGALDELRLYPLGAQMTSYTYTPLVGISSQSDINNRILYYQYDNLGRLFVVRDQDRNIVKKYCYTYQGQSESCTLYGNDALSGTYYKQCPSGQTGSAVTYTVPANTYYGFSTAEANALAQEDISQNGQTYANQNGTCTTSCSFTAASGFGISTSGISSSGTSVSFYIVFYSNSGSTPYWSGGVQVATITGCRPSVTRTFNMSEGGRTWEVTVTPSGSFSIRLVSGTAPCNGCTIGLTGGSYNL